MPQPHTGELVPSGNQLWTFDSLGNLIVKGSIYSGGVPDPTKPGPGQPLVPGTLVSPPAGQANAVVLLPSGDVSGATDPANIAALYNLGAKTVTLAQGTFYANTPVLVPPYCALVGQYNSTQRSTVDGGTVLAVTAGFTGLTFTDSGPVTVTAAIVLLGQAQGGYGTVSEEQKIRNLMIDGSAGPQGCSGVFSYGRVQRVQLSEVAVIGVTATGFSFSTLDHAGNQPDAFYGYKCFAYNCGANGFSLRCADSTWVLCLGSNNGSPDCDWFINTTSNSKYIGCRSEHATAGLGFGYVCVNAGNSSGGVLFSGCSTDQSFAHGFQVGGTIARVATSAGVALTFAGCVFRRDGANGGSGGGGYAGFYDAGYPGQVTMAGLTVWPGVNDNGTGTNSPQIGLLADAGSKMNVGAAYIQGATTAITDNSAGAINWDNSVVTATGTTAAPTIVASPNIAAYQGKSLTLTPPAAPTVDPLLIVSANSGERAFGMKVAGDSFDRIKLTSDGKINLGPGNAAGDTVIQRGGVGTVTLPNVTLTGKLTTIIAAPVNAKPANPAGTVSTTDVMAGFAVAYTPASSGVCLVIVTGEGNTATAVTNFNVGGRYGTGTAPANGAAVTGTRFGSAADLQPRPSGISSQTSFALNDVLALTPGTTYWFDLEFSTNNASDSANLRNVSISIVELS